MKKILVVATLLMLGACSDAPTAERILKNSGLTNIQTTGYSFFGCGKDDMFSTGFTATGPTGAKVSGVVCSGLMKGGTIRFN